MSTGTKKIAPTASGRKLCAVDIPTVVIEPLNLLVPSPASPVKLKG